MRRASPARERASTRARRPGMLRLRIDGWKRAVRVEYVRRGAAALVNVSRAMGLGHTSVIVRAVTTNTSAVVAMGPATAPTATALIIATSSHRPIRRNGRSRSQSRLLSEEWTGNKDTALDYLRAALLPSYLPPYDPQRTRIG